MGGVVLKVKPKSRDAFNDSFTENKRLVGWAEASFNPKNTSFSTRIRYLRSDLTSPEVGGATFERGYFLPLVGQCTLIK